MNDNIYPRSGGRSWRKIDLRNEDANTAVGWLEDDFHHFGVTIIHHRGVIADVRTAAPRYPWITCPEAGDGLRALIGRPLVSRATDIGALVDMRHLCTHMFDLAGLVLAQACRAAAHRRYEACVSDRPVTQWLAPADGILGPGRAVLYRDEWEVLAWDVDARAITGPAAHAGRSLDRGFRAWIDGLPEEEAECASVLRRAILIAGGRNIDYDRIETADETGVPPVCYSFQPQRRAQARHMHGSVINYEEGEGMLAEVHRIP